MWIVFLFLLPLLGIFLLAALALRLIDHIRGRKGTTSRTTLLVAAIIAIFTIGDLMGLLIPALKASNLLR
jgi:hypothetical protein